MTVFNMLVKRLEEERTEVQQQARSLDNAISMLHSLIGVSANRRPLHGGESHWHRSYAGRSGERNRNRPLWAGGASEAGDVAGGERKDRGCTTSPMGKVPSNAEEKTGLNIKLIISTLSLSVNHLVKAA